MSAKASAIAYDEEEYEDDDLNVGSQESFITQSRREFEQMYDSNQAEKPAAKKRCSAIAKELEIQEEMSAKESKTKEDNLKQVTEEEERKEDTNYRFTRMESRISVLEGDVKQVTEEKERKEDHTNYRFTRMESRISVLEGDVNAISQKVNKINSALATIEQQAKFPPYSSSIQSDPSSRVVVVNNTVSAPVSAAVTTAPSFHNESSMTSTSTSVSTAAVARCV